MPKRTMPQVSGIDGLRAFAIIGIVLYHMIPRFVPGGFLGVTMFFTLMGFLMIYTNRLVIEGETRKFSISGYYKKKVLRLYPPLIIVVFLSVLLLMILPVHYTKGTFGELASIFLGYNNWWQVLKNSSYFTRISNASPFTHLWYLGLTIQYYLIWPFIVILLAKQKKKGNGITDRVLLIIVSVLFAASAVEMAVLYKPNSDPSRIYYGTDTRAYSLFLGMVVALLPRDFTEWLSEKLDRIRYSRGIAAGILFGAMTVMYILVDGTHTATYRGLMQLFNILAALVLVLLLISQETLGKFLESKPIAWIGQKSYIIYLIMYPVIFFVSRMLKKDGTLAGSIISIILIGVLAYAIDKFDKFFRGKYGSYIVFKTPEQNRKKIAKRKARKQLPQAVIRIQNICKRVFKLVTASYRNMLACMLAVTILLSGAQSIYMHYTHPDDDSAVLEEQIENNKKLLEAQTAASEGADAQSDSESETDETDTDAEEVTSTYPITAVGDSVMLGAAAQLAEAMPNMYIDAEIGRQVRDTVDVLTADEANHVLGDTVILHLGTNGIFNQATGQEVIDYLGSDRTIYWINVYGPGLDWQNDVNTIITALCDANANVILLDWAAQASQHAEWFYSDGIHLNPEGAQAYSDFIRVSVTE